MNVTDRFGKIDADLEKYCDLHDVKWGFKPDDFWMRVLGKIMFFNKKFMTSFTTTRGDRVFFPTGQEWLDEVKARFSRIMSHELGHVFDYRTEGWWKFGAGYIRPQLWGALGLLGFLGFLYPPLFALFAFLLFLCPWKSKKRTSVEMRGYAITMAWYKWVNGTVLIDDPAWVKENFGWIVRAFTGSGYYYMWWDEEEVLQELCVWIRRINDGTFSKFIPIAKDLEHILKGKGLPENPVKF